MCENETQSGVEATYPGKRAYQGDEAARYEASRSRLFEWDREQAIVEKLCRQWPRGSKILDIPCGTGRLIPLFERYGHQVWGADISADMLAMIPPSSLELPALRDLALVEAEHLPFVDGSFDYVVSLRFFHLELPVTVAETILHEFSRIACKGIVLHGPLEEWKLLPRVADSIIEICTSGWGVPIVLAKRTRRAMQLIQNRLRPGRGGSSGENTIVGQRGFSCTPKELERVIGQEGFNVTASYGAISSFSTKRIHMLDKSTVPPF